MSEKRKTAFDYADEQNARQKAREKRAKADKPAPKKRSKRISTVGEIMDRKYRNQTTDGGN